MTRDSDSGIEIELPHFEFGDIVYQRVANMCGTRCIGIVDGFMICPGFAKVRARWNGNQREYHYPFELTTEPPPAPEQPTQKDA
jgi:hypothetical protein